nr:hypothetical protein [uncultured Prevotella sp.]
MSISKYIVVILLCLLASCSKNSADVYLFRVIDNYPKQVSKENVPHYQRLIKLQFWVKNNTMNKMYIPLNITYGCAMFKSSIKVLSSKGTADKIEQSMKGGNRCVIGAGQEVNIELKLHQDDLERLGFVKNVPTCCLIKKIKFIYDKNNEDESLMTIPNVIFHNINIKKDMKTIYQESSLNWNVDFDASQNIVYCYVIPGRKVREIRSIK